MDDAMTSFLGWEGFLPIECSRQPGDGLLIVLAPDPRRPARCGTCKQVCSDVHDTNWRYIRDQNLFEHKVILHVPVRRLRCSECGNKREYLSWLAPRSRITERMRVYLETLLSLLPIKHVSNLTDLHWDTLKSIDKCRLSREVTEPDKSKLRFLVMDEFALFKGHRYASVVLDAERKQVLWVGEGRSRQAIRPFFEWLGVHCENIKAVAMDMNTAMDLEVQAHCPNARVVYDLFHVIAKFGREVVDRVRVDQANALRGDRPARKAIKRSRWLLLRNRSNLPEDQAVKLDELLAINQPLMTVYVMKEQLKDLWYAPTKDEAEIRWNRWYSQAMESGLAPLIQFARRLRGYVAGIIASATYRLNTSVLEGINNRIKVIKRMGYGYRDSEYFFLKIKAAFPGVPG